MLQIVTTVLVAASDYDLVTLDDVKAELSVTGVDSDAQLGRYISAASAAAAQYCNRVFVRETVKDVIDIEQDPYRWQVPGGSDALNLSRYPVANVISILVGQNAAPLVADQGYRLNAGTGQLFRLNAYDGAVCRWDALPVVATYEGGFADIPWDVQDAVTRMIRARWFARGRDPYTRSESVPGVGDVSYWVPTGADAGNLTPDVADLLDNYRVPVVA